MTPKDKARELTDLSYKIQIKSDVVPDWEIAKRQAEIVAVTVINLFKDNKYDSRYDYYVEVKNQIQKL